MSAGRRPGPTRRLTDADLVTLTVLVDGPAHGQAIWNRLVSCEIEDWAAASRAQVYYSIRKLADQSLIRPASGSGSEDARERHVWCVTPEGRRALTASLTSEHWAGQRAISPFMTWVGLAELARPATRKKMLARRGTFLDSELERSRKTLVQLKQLPTKTPGARVAVSMVRQVIRQLELESAWLKELRRVLGPQGG